MDMAIIVLYYWPVGIIIMLYFNIFGQKWKQHLIGLLGINSFGIVISSLKVNTPKRTFFFSI